MPRIPIVFLSLVLFAGCAKDGQFIAGALTTSPCTDATGYTFTGIVYGDSKMVVIPMSKIRAGAEWRFYLRPANRSSDPINYDTVNVHIKGKFPAATPPPNGNDWIDVSGAFDTSGSHHYLVECVPASVMEGDVFEYLVKIDEVGELDPRARVD